MGQLFESSDTGFCEYTDSTNRMSKSARSRKSVGTPFTIVGTESMTVDSAFSEMSISDESELTDEGRLSRALQSWMTDYVIVPIEPAVKPKRQLVYSGRLGKRPNLQRVPSDESLETKISLLSCSSGEDKAGKSSATQKTRRRKRAVGSRTQSAMGRETPKRTWEDFAREKSKGAFDRFMRAQNVVQLDRINTFENDESEAFQMLEKDEQRALFNAGSTHGIKLTSTLQRSDSDSNVNKKDYTRNQRTRIKRTLSAGAKPQSKPINLEEIRQQKLKEKMALLQKQQQMRRRDRSRRSLFSSSFSKTTSSKSSIASEAAPNTPSERSLSPESTYEPIQMWKGDREILEIDLRAGLTDRVKKRITATTSAINRVTGLGENNRMQTVVGRHEEFPHLVEEDYAVLPKIVQRIRISPQLSHVIKDDIKVRMGRPRYHEIKVKDIEIWSKHQKLDRSHRNLKVFNWLHSLREEDFDKDIEPYIQDNVPSADDEVEVIHVEAADEPDVKPLYLTKFDLIKPK